MPLPSLILQSDRQSAVSEHSAKALVHVLIASSLDYCNCVLHRINTSSAKTLQSVLHSAARLIMQKWKFDSINLTNCV